MMEAVDAVQRAEAAVRERHRHRVNDRVDTGCGLYVRRHHVGIKHLQKARTRTNLDAQAVTGEIAFVGCPTLPVQLREHGTRQWLTRKDPPVDVDEIGTIDVDASQPRLREPAPEHLSAPAQATVARCQGTRRANCPATPY